MIVLYYIFSALLAFFYIYIIARYLEGWGALPKWEIPTSFQAQTSVSVIIAARNEAANISECLDAILNQSYPKELFEVIVVDDHSTDATLDLLQSYSDPRLKIFQLKNYISHPTNAYKKKAVELGIGQANGTLIVATDADCIMGQKWLSFLVSYYQTYGSKFIAAPVQFFQETSFLERFQSLDFMGMMCVTGAGIHRRFMHMCNGANLAYEKSAFEAVKGFDGIDNIASGDDMLLMQKIAKKYPGQISFIKNKSASTFTKAKSTLHAFLQQRIRWASKSSSYQEWKVTFILAMIFLFCVNILTSFFLIPFFSFEMGLLFLGQIVVKIGMDFFFLNKMSHFFDRRELMQLFLPAQIAHIFYIVWVGAISNFSKTYEWKGRKVR